MEAAVMIYQRLPVQRWVRATDTMLGQIRTLFLGFLLLWPLIGLWGVVPHRDARPIVVAAVAIVVLLAWSYAGYRRSGSRPGAGFPRGCACCWWRPPRTSAAPSGCASCG